METKFTSTKFLFIFFKNGAWHLPELILAWPFPGSRMSWISVSLSLSQQKYVWICIWSDLCKHYVCPVYQYTFLQTCVSLHILCICGRFSFLYVVFWLPHVFSKPSQKFPPSRILTIIHQMSLSLSSHYSMTVRAMAPKFLCFLMGSNRI